ncbi:MAG: hypothetical protein ACE5GJ_14120 [Gemmatimonadota bacterium]
MSVVDLFWLFIILSSLAPLLQQRTREAQRAALLHRMEKSRGSRVISLIHRQEALSFLGMAFARYIDIEDSEAILRAIRMTDDDVPIDLVLHTPGGLVLAAEQIAWALAEHPAKVTVFIPHYAMSGGTLLALAADEVVMDSYAVLGPVDPQLGQFAAASILAAVERKDVNKVDDQTLIMADLAKKAIQQVREAVEGILETRGVEAKKAKHLADILSKGRWTHDYPIRVSEARELGMEVSTEMPPEIYVLMQLYPQSGKKRPSVQYVDGPRGGGSPKSPPARPAGSER